MICVDLDGTLLNDQHKINHTSLATLKKADHMGIKVVVSTGRHGVDAMYHAGLIANDAYYIGANGAIVGKVDTEFPLYLAEISKDNISILLDFFENHNLQPILYTEKAIYVTHFRTYFFHLINTIRFKQKKNHKIILIKNNAQIRETFLRENIAILKIVLFISNMTKADEIEKRLKSMSSLETARTFKFSIEITNAGINKAYGIKVLSESLSITNNEIIAFGDSENDIEMLKYVGMGIAMGNADQHVKAIANEITETNNNGGIAKSLEKLLGL